jgi:hypothetical protein
MTIEKIEPLLVALPQGADDLQFGATSGFGAIEALGLDPESYITGEEIRALEQRLAAAGHSYAWVRLSADGTPDGKKALKAYGKTGEATFWAPQAPDDDEAWRLAAVLDLGEPTEADDQMKGVDVLALWLKPPSAAFGSDAHAELFMVGDLMTAAKLRFMDLAVPWPQLSEEEQGRVLSGLADDVRRACTKAIRIIAHHGRVEFRAQVDQVNFKGDDEVKAVLKMVNSSEAHSLADVAGGYVTVIIEQNDELLAIPDDMTRGEPDQRPLFDLSTEPQPA